MMRLRTRWRLRSRGSWGAAWLALLVVAIPARAGETPPLDKRISQYGHVAWQEKNGLPDEMVGAILQTRDGYVWFGTLNGLARFDGVRFTVFDAVNSEAPLLHRVTCLFEVRDGSLWAGSRNGLTRYHQGRFESFPFPAGLTTGGVRQILEDAEGRLWARTRSDLLTLRANRLEVVARRVRAIALRPEGGLRVITPEGFGHLEGDGVEIERTGPAVPGETSPLAVISEVAEEPDGTMWLGALWGLGRLEPGGEWTVYTRRDGLPDTAVTAVRLDAKGTLWVGTAQGIARFKGGHLVRDDAPPLLSGRRIQVIYDDREGSLWIGTDTDGVHQLRDGLFTPLTVEEGLSDDLVTPILETRTEPALWIGTARGLNRIRGGHVQTFTSHDGLSDDGIFALAEDREARLWVGTGKGLDYRDGERFRSAADGGLPRISERVTAVTAGDDGSLWVGTDASGAYRIAGRSVTHLTMGSGLSNNHVARIHQRPDGSIWIGTDGGITRWASGKITFYGTAEGLPSAQVRAFHEAGDSLWIGTYGGGLCRYRDGQFRAVPPGLPDNVVYAILEDGEKHFWLSSNRGILRVARAALDAAADGAPGGLPFVLYDVGDGLKSSACVGNCQPAAWKARDGRFWFPTRRGAVWIDPAQPLRRDAPLTPLIERVLVDGRPQPVGEGAVAPPGRGDLVFDYTAPSFRHPAALHFRYRLDGFDADWQDAGPRRTAQYTKVPPGHYRFRVATLSADGVLGSGEAVTELRLRPQFYETTWFYAACATAGLLLAASLYRAKLHQVKSRFALVLVERNRIARDMHDALDQGFAAITLQLNLCAKMAENEAESRAALKQRLELADRLLEYTRAESKRSISDLRSHALEAGDLAGALTKVAEAFRLGGLKIGVSVAGPARRLPGAVENNLLRICQEAVANAVRHGEAREVAIDLAFAARTVALVVKDDGRGFDAATVVSERDGHFGLMGMRERAQRLGGRLELASLPGQGTEVRVAIPVPE